MILLEYEKQTFLDLVEADGLLVCAKGLSYDRVVIRILKAYSDSGNLVVVINSSDWEEQYYKSKIEPKYVHEVASTATEREPVYLEGRYRGELTKTFHQILQAQLDCICLCFYFFRIGALEILLNIYTKVIIFRHTHSHRY
ncbi:DNA repair endonuclease XPF-like [Drosophila simulans]|uniref:DNA repair endonuclease XPF-like n=1 Tax=Drosophila simulans TaxID=7240 RepID=UPI00192D0035|nr:DNA repair endonuclease XPF-like [Drosophila simulans]